LYNLQPNNYEQVLNIFQVWRLVGDYSELLETSGLELLPAGSKRNFSSFYYVLEFKVNCFKIVFTSLGSIVN